MVPPTKWRTEVFVFTKISVLFLAFTCLEGLHLLISDEAQHLLNVQHVIGLDMDKGEAGFDRQFQHIHFHSIERMFRELDFNTPNGFVKMFLQLIASGKARISVSEQVLNLFPTHLVSEGVFVAQDRSISGLDLGR